MWRTTSAASLWLHSWDVSDDLLRCWYAASATNRRVCCGDVSDCLFWWWNAASAANCRVHCGDVYDRLFWQSSIPFRRSRSLRLPVLAMACCISRQSSSPLRKCLWVSVLALSCCISYQSSIPPRRSLYLLRWWRAASAVNRWVRSEDVSVSCLAYVSASSSFNIPILSAYCLRTRSRNVMMYCVL